MIDFKDFKKTKEDADTVTMAHHKGHSIKILKKALPHIQQEALKRLPFDTGGVALKPGDSLQVDPVNDTPPTDAAPADTNPNGASSSGAPLDVAPVVEADTNAVNVSQLPSQSVNYGLQAGDTRQDLEEKMAKGMAGVDIQKMKNAEISQAATKQTMDDMRGHVNEFAQDMRGLNVNPNAYGESQTDAQKSQTAIGLFLGGLGSGNGPNPALEFLNQNINRNIDAQKNKQDVEKTIYGAYKQLYNDENASTALTKITMNDRLLAQADLVAQNLGTPAAQARNQQLKSEILGKNFELLQNAAGYHVNSVLQQQNQQQGSQPIPGGIDTTGSILNSNAKALYDNLQFDKVHTEPQKQLITTQYNNSVQVDKALKQIEELGPQLKGKATLSGYLADKINPNTMGTMGALAGGAIGAGMAAVGAPETAGTSLAAMAPAAAKGAAVGAGVGETGAYAVKQGLTALGGHQEEQYKNAKESFDSIIAGALKNSGMTPTKIEEVAHQLTTGFFDDKATYEDRMAKLRKKIHALTETGAIQDAGMTNEK